VANKVLARRDAWLRVFKLKPGGETAKELGNTSFLYKRLLGNITRDMVESEPNLLHMHFYQFLHRCSPDEHIFPYMLDTSGGGKEEKAKHGTGGGTHEQDSI
jgi:hypothetical protein